MKVFGLTGGIGMGKSAAEKILHERGVPVIDTDALARQIVEPGQPAWKEIQHAFGNEVLAPDGRLNREVLAKIIFSNGVARQKLEAITHPRIQVLWQEQLHKWRAEKKPLAVVVIPLLFETAAEKEFDRTICVACSAVTQQERLQARGWSAVQIRQRIAAQWPAEKKMAWADFVVWSEGGLEVLAAQLIRIFPLGK